MNQLTTFQHLCLLLARACLASIFLVAGWLKIDNFVATASFLADDQQMILANLLLVTIIIIEFGGGLLLLFGWLPRLAAAVLAIFVLLITLLSGAGHWSINFSEYALEPAQLYKNIAIVGGLLYVIIIGPGRFSINGHPAKRVKLNKLF